MTTERIPFRLIVMPCCGTKICHVNHRLPNYCSECGERHMGQLRGHVLISDMDASLVYDADKLV